MGRWVFLLFLALIVLAVVGFLVEAARFVLGGLFVACLVVLGVRYLRKRGR